MQINAQSAIKSPWLEIAKENYPLGVTVNSAKSVSQTDSVTLSAAGLALASGKTVESEITAYGSWPVWPRVSGDGPAEK